MGTIEALEAGGMLPEEAAVEATLNSVEVMGNIPSGVLVDFNSSTFLCLLSLLSNSLSLFIGSCVISVICVSFVVITNHDNHDNISQISKVSNCSN